jgi:DNA repair protein RecO (recombination protein O)
MLQTTKAIVLNAFAYNETSIITNLYTKEFGLKGYIAKGIRKKTSSISASIFQPLQPVEVEVYNNQRQALQVLRNASITDSISDLRSNIVKSTLTMFLTEIMLLSIREENPDNQMFEFLYSKIQSLNNANKSLLSDYHICFMIEFANVLGFNIKNYKWQTQPNSRQTLLAELIAFYEQHITAGRKIKSHTILHEILH